MSPPATTFQVRCQAAELLIPLVGRYGKCSMVLNRLSVAVEMPEVVEACLGRGRSPSPFGTMSTALRITMCDYSDMRSSRSTSTVLKKTRTTMNLTKMSYFESAQKYVHQLNIEHNGQPYPELIASKPKSRCTCRHIRRSPRSSNTPGRCCITTMATTEDDSIKRWID